MTSLKKALFKKSAGNNKTYFQYSLKQNWQHFAFYLILMLLVVVMPTVMTVHASLSSNYYTSYPSYDARQQTGGELIIITSVLTFVASCAVSVFAFMSAASYVNSKQAVGCFHSFPLTRSFLFFTETGVKAIYFLGSLGITSLLAYSIICFNFPIAREANSFYFQILLLSVLTFCLFFSIGMLAAGLAGTALLRFLMFGVIVALPIAIYLLICAAIDLGMQDVDIDPYFEFDFVKWLCPVTFLADIILRLGGEMGGEINFPLSLLLILIPAVLFYIGALLLHMKRKSETSGTSIIWKPVFSIIKYAVMFMCTLGGGLFFGALSGDLSGWYFFGSVCGLILSFMLTNVILYRSVRSLFKGVRGLCVMAVAMLLFSIFTVYDAANLNAHMWSAGNTRSLTLTLDNVTVKYTDDEDIDALVPMLKEFMLHKNESEYNRAFEYMDTLIPVDGQTAADMGKYMGIYQSGKYYEYYDEDGYYREQVYYETVSPYYGDPELEDIIAGNVTPYTNQAIIEDIKRMVYDIGYSPYSLSISWRQMPYVGILSSKRMGIDYTSATKELIEYIIASDEYAAALNEVKKLELDDVGDISTRIFGFETQHYYSRFDRNIEEDFRRLIDAYEFTNEKRLNSPLVGRIQIWAGENYLLPVYAEDYEVLNLCGEWYGLDFDFQSVDDVYEFMAADSDAVFLIEKETGRTVSITEQDAKKELIKGLPHTEIIGGIAPESDGDKYYAVVIYRGYKEGENIQTYIVPIRPSKEGEMSKYFPQK